VPGLPRAPQEARQAMRYGGGLPQPAGRPTQSKTATYRLGKAFGLVVAVEVGCD
jgi:hypothetical protein